MNAEALAEKIGAEMLDTIERNRRIIKADLVEAAKRVIEQEKPYWLAARDRTEEDLMRQGL